MWCTMVGGYYFLDSLKTQGCVITHDGQEWNDFLRLDHDLTAAGVPKADEFKVVLHDASVV